MFQPLLVQAEGVVNCAANDVEPLSCVDIYCESVVTSEGENCDAQFDFHVTGDTVSFTGFATGAAPYFFDWDYGDGTLGTGESTPAHRYAAEGTYDVCMTVTDANGCVVTICQEVNFAVHSNCNANFEYTVNEYTVDFVDHSTSPLGPFFVYNWDFGDGISSTLQYPIHTYGDPGTYAVCLSVTDAGGCTSQYCEDVIIGEPPAEHCVASFNYTANSHTVLFDNTSSVGGEQATHDDLMYFWDFGDGETAVDFEPGHYYENAGTYTVCLTVADTAGCSNDFCSTISVGNTVGTTVSGVVNSYMGMPISEGTAFLYEIDPVIGLVRLKDSVTVYQGAYVFHGVMPGSYLVKASLNPSHLMYEDHLPTYLGNELFWYNATMIVVNSSPVLNTSIELTEGFSALGSGFIGGYAQSVAHSLTSPVPLNDVSILLLNQNDTAITHIVTNDEGWYEFRNLAFGTYKVYIEIAGFYIPPMIVTLDGEYSTLIDVDFLVNLQNGITNTNIEELSDAVNVIQYPNPVEDILYLEMDVVQRATFKVSVNTFLGEELVAKELRLGAGNQRTELDLADLQSGIYFLRVESEDEFIIRKIVKL